MTLNRFLLISISLIFIAAGAVGCSEARFTAHEPFETEKLPRPGGIWVRDFFSNPEEIPPSSALAKHIEKQRLQSEQEIEAGRKLGVEIATQLVAEIQAMNLPAAKYTAESKPQLSDIVIQGYLFCMEKGNKAKRMTIGFGAGASRLCAAVEIFQVTDKGLHPVVLGDIESKSGRRPGAPLGAAGIFLTASPAGLIISSAMHALDEVSGRATLETRATLTAKELAEELEKQFKAQGWIGS